MVHTLIVHAVAALRAGGPEALQRDPHYRALLHAVLSLPGAQNAEAREAVVLRSFGLLSDRLPQAILRLGLHPISTPGTS